MPVSFTLDEIQRLGQERLTLAPQLFYEKPAIPDNITASAERGGRFRIQWSKVDEVDGYRVAISSDRDFSAPDLLLDVPGEDSLEKTYTVGNIATTKYFAVQSYKGAESSDLSSIVSASSSIADLTTRSVNTTRQTHTGSTAETIILTYTVPGNTLGSNDGFHIVVGGNFAAGSVDNRTLRVRWGGIGGTIIGQVQENAVGNVRINCYLFNRNATNSQVSQHLGYHTTTVDSHSLVTSSRDTTSNQDIVVTGQLVDSTDNLHVDLFIVNHIAGSAESLPSSPPSPPPSPPSGSDTGFERFSTR